jgi:hypothetical protein
MIFHEYLLNKRHEELLAEAEHARLIKKAKPPPVKGSSFYARSLAWLGGILCNLGSLLKERFGEEVAINHSQSIDRSLNV